jgi:ribosome-binding protein aMBF1 (putative translation factor)
MSDTSDREAVLAERGRLERERAVLRRALDDVNERLDQIEAEYVRQARVKARVTLGVSQKMLARIAGLHPSTVRRFERGGDVSYGTVRPLCEALGVSPDYLFGLAVVGGES